MPARSTSSARKRGRIVEEARRSVAELLGAETREIVFTSGGTESDNSALWGVFRSGSRTGNHIITTKIEHPAILATCKALESSGAEVTYVPVDASGRVDPAAIEAGDPRKHDPDFGDARQQRNRSHPAHRRDQPDRRKPRHHCCTRMPSNPSGKFPPMCAISASTCFRCPATRFTGRKESVSFTYGKGPRSLRS